MRIAIVGGGLAGLACAHELERLGLAPDLFEKGSCVGDRAISLEIMAQFMHVNPGQDILAYLQDELMLPIRPAYAVAHTVVESADTAADLGGQLGYVTLRGRDDRSLERQLARHVSARVHFWTEPDLDELQREYDVVVVATGDQRLTAGLGAWEPDLSWGSRGAMVRGRFQPGELRFFLQTRYASTGYAQLIPVDERMAMASVVVPNAVAAECVDRHWEAFRAEQGYRWDAEESQFQVTNFACGRVRPVVSERLLLIGAAGGFTEPLGLTGQCPALSSGVMAARQIALRDRSLERFARRWRVYYTQVSRLRRMVDGWSDADMDRLTRSLRVDGHFLSRSPRNWLAPGAASPDWHHLADQM